MKFGLVTSNSFNLGDEIQALAAAQYLPRVDYYLDREALHRYPLPEKSKVLMNGWYMYSPSNWPPSPDIEPLYISMHVDPKHRLGLLDFLHFKERFTGKHRHIAVEQHAEYFKRHQPIGCRDVSTQRLFDAIGVTNYFSGCLSLTLSSDSCRLSALRDKLVFVDPFSKLPPSNYRRNLWRRIPKSIRKEALCLSHFTLRSGIQWKLTRAHELLTIYASAKLVVTSRLHCALPCLALGTPVVFLDTRSRPERLEGYAELLSPVSFEQFFDQLSDIESLACTPNANTLEHLQNKLRKTCQRFLNSQT